MFIDLTDDDAMGTISGLPEVEQYEALKTFFDGRKVHYSYLEAPGSINPSIIAKEVADWNDLGPTKPR